MNTQTVNSGRPKAYLNWVLLDEQFKYAGGGFEQVGDNEVFTTHTRTNLSVNKNGYLYVYVSNETPNVDVFFDNLQVSHIRGPLLEETHYYPFGLTMAGISSKAVGKLENKNNKFQSQEYNQDLGVDIYEFKYRMDDPQIGRFWQVDPLADKYVYNSTYAFSEKKVTSHIELEGLEAVSIQLSGRLTVLFGSTSGGVGIILDKSGNLMATGTYNLGMGAGFGGNIGVGFSVYPKANSYDELLGFGIQAGAMLPNGMDLGANLSYQSGKNDVRLGASFGPAKLGVSFLAAGYFEFGNTWPLLDKPINLKEISDNQAKKLAETLGISIETLYTYINALQKNMNEIQKHFVTSNVPLVSNTTKPIKDHPEDRKTQKKLEQEEWLQKTRSERGSILNQY